MASHTLSEPIQKELFEIKAFDVVLLPRVSVFTLILGTRPGEQGVLWKTLDTIKQSAIRVARRTPDSVTSQESLVTYFEIEDSLCGSCCWERHRQTSQFAKILIWLSAVSKSWTKLQNSVSV